MESTGSPACLTPEKMDESQMSSINWNKGKDLDGQASKEDIKKSPDKLVSTAVSSTVSVTSPIRARKPRTAFSDQQLRLLEACFQKQKYMAAHNRAALAERLGLSDVQVKTWYQNRRTKWKRRNDVGMQLLGDSSNVVAFQRAVENNSKWIDDFAAMQTHAVLPHPGNARMPWPSCSPYPSMPCTLMGSGTPKPMGQTLGEGSVEGAAAARIPKANKAHTISYKPTPQRAEENATETNGAEAMQQDE